MACFKSKLKLLSSRDNDVTFKKFFQIANFRKTFSERQLQKSISKKRTFLQ